NGTPYAIPADNPFVDKPGLDEIYAYGLRNAFRFSFDRGESHTMLIPDVGQNLFEEVNIGTRGGNYGWAIREGAHCFDPHNQNTPLPSCDTTGLIDPIAEYTHADGLAVIGGHVYRGATRPDLHGIYIFGDFSQNFGPTGRLFYIDMNNDRHTIYEVQLPEQYSPLNRYVYGFGEDDQGELYLLTTTSLNPNAPTGELFRIK
ncbi:hypothetical protein GF356_09415, partial [candidate division GN15 bacterium]|nr:hypothetical protein [candidate division GN15 bacterium]